MWEPLYSDGTVPFAREVLMICRRKEERLRVQYFRTIPGIPSLSMAFIGSRHTRHLVTLGRVTRSKTVNTELDMGPVGNFRFILVGSLTMFHAIWKPRAVCRLHRAVCRLCVLWRDNFKENRDNCHDFIVLCCVRNWEGISVVENLVRHNNRSFRANKLVIVSPSYKQENK